MTDSTQLTIAIITLIVTGITGIATVAMSIANFCSAKTMKKQFQVTEAQLVESKRQYNETRRLEVMPYLQARIEDGKIDEKGQPQCPYSQFLLTESDEDNMIYEVKFITIYNVGLGITHHTKLRWILNEKSDGAYPDTDIVIPPDAEWGLNILFKAKKAKSDHPSTFRTPKCSMHIEYQDLLGNSYHQDLLLFILVTDKEIIFHYQYVTSPKLNTNNTTPNPQA